MTAAITYGKMPGVGENAWRPDGKPPTAAQLRKRFDSGWLTVEDIAAVEDISPATWRGYYQKGQAGAPAPERHRSGRPEWKAATIAKWIAARPGRGNWGER